MATSHASHGFSPLRGSACASSTVARARRSRAALVEALAGVHRPADTLGLWAVGGVLLLATAALLAVLYLLARGEAKGPVELAFTAFMGVYFGLLGLLMGVPGRARAG